MAEKFRPQLEWKLPLSGDVSVPVAMPGSYGGQFGMFNINLGGSGDAAMEQEMLDRVGSYGRQIGWLSDVIGVILAELETKNPELGKTKAVEVFKAMAGEIAHTKRLHKPKATNAT